jgi:hypothetical protein
MYVIMSVAALLKGRLHGAFSVCVSMSDKPFDPEACGIGGQTSATNGLSDIKKRHPQTVSFTYNPQKTAPKFGKWFWHQKCMPNPKKVVPTFFQCFFFKRKKQSVFWGKSIKHTHINRKKYTICQILDFEKNLTVSCQNAVFHQKTHFRHGFAFLKIGPIKKKLVP